MLETNVHKFLEGNKSHVYLKTESKVDDIRKEIKDNTIRMISVQSKAFKGHAEKLKGGFTYTLKEDNDAKLPQK